MNNHSEANDASQFVQLAPMTDPAEAESEKQINPFKRLHQLLRGRYHWAILLGVVGALGGAFAGYNLTELRYQANGMIRVRPVVPTILYENEDSGVMPMFKAFVDSQRQLMQSPRVVSMAMESEAWRQFDRGLTPEARHAFESSLTIDRAGGEILTVRFKDTDKDAALTAVEATINAYMRLYGEKDVREETQRLRVLEERRTALSNQLDSIRSRIRVIADEYGSDALEQMYQFNVQELQKLESALKEAQLELAAAGAEEQDKAAEDEAIDAAPQRRELDPETMPIERIAEYDPKVNRLWEEKKATESSLEILATRFGDNHRQVKFVKAQLATIQKQLNERVAWFRDNTTASELRGASSITRNARGADIDLLKQRVDQLEQLYGDAREDTLQLGRQKLEIDALKEDAERVSKRLEETRFRIEQLNVESAVSGRLEVISKGDLMPGPLNAGKRKQLTLLGFVGGGGIGMSLIVLLGFLDRRLYDSGDAQGRGRDDVRLLGLLPELPEDLSDPEQARAAGYCVHHIRTMLQIGGQHAPRVIAITSGAGGSGKTSLTLSLGLSYGSCGSRTLLIDVDLFGSGLTRRLEAIKRRRIGQVLRQHGFITEEQLDHALKLSRDTGDPLGASLVGMGVLSASDVDHALTLQETSPVGLLDTLEGEPLTECVAETGIPGVDILPVGGAGAHDTSRLSPDSMHRLLEKAAEAYGVILIDTGPVPGSIESAIAAAAADAVVPIFARGEDRLAAQRCLDFLESINAHAAGVVFNRATSNDIARSAFSSSLSKKEDNGATVATVADDDPTSRRASQFGPIAHAVVRSSRRR